MQKSAARIAAVCTTGFASHALLKKQLRDYGVADANVSWLDISVVLLKSKVLEGNYFANGLGPNLDAVSAALERLKTEPAARVDVEWRSRWEARTSPLTGARYWVRRGTFDSPVAALLPDEAKEASFWEVRGSEPAPSEDISVAGGKLFFEEDSRLPLSTYWLGVPVLDSIIDESVRRLNAPKDENRRLAGACTSSALVLLPDFAGDFCKRTVPIAELVAFAQPGLPIYLLEFPLRGTRRPASAPGVGSLLHELESLAVMGCAAIEESRALLRWLADGSGRPRDTSLTLAGLSMGGHVAALTAACSTHVRRLALLLPAHSGEASWLDGGAMSLCRALPAEEMRPLLREATNVESYPPLPSGVELAVLVAGRRDAVVPFWSSQRLRAHLEAQGVSHVELRELPGGHTSSVLARQQDLAQAILDVVEARS